ncbi:MAG TPA: ABC transporter permease subunit [Stellaceae bacterium]|nr:ABC transporter permease subunit [Stellaceae bacterium]
MRTLSLRAASILLLIFIWWLGATLIADPEILPGPLAVARGIASILTSAGPEGESSWFDIGITLARIVVAFSAAMLAGIGLGLAMGLSRGFDSWMQAIIPSLLTLPTILMVFLSVLWFGFSEAGGLVAVVVLVTPYVAVNIAEGARAMDKSLIDMAVTFKAGRRLRLKRIYLPQLLPYIFSAFRYAFGMTWKIVALAETFGLKFGIGYMFSFWFNQSDMGRVLAWIILFVVLMLILEHGVFARLEAGAFRWRTPIAAR